MEKLKKIKEKILGKKKRIPPKKLVVPLTPEIIEKMPDYFKKQIAELQAENEILRQKIEQLQKKLDEYEGKVPSETELMAKELLKRKAMIQRKERERTIIMKLIGPLPRCRGYDGRLFSDGKRKYSLLWGYAVIETDEGNLLYNPILTTPQGGNKITVRAMLPWNMLHVEPDKYVSHVKSGVVTLRLDTRGIFHPPKEFANIPPSPYDEKYYEKLISMKRKYEEEIAKLNKTVEELATQLQQALKREVKKEGKIRDLQMATEINDFRADIAEAMSLKALRKLKEFGSELTAMYVPLVNETINRIYTEYTNVALVKGFKELRERLGIELPKEEEEKIREKVLAEMRDMVDFLKLKSIEESKAAEVEKGGGAK